MNEFEDNPILDHIRARLWRRNQNWIAAIVGGVGTSKSWSALAIADYVDRNFDISKVYFRIKDFVNAINEKRIPKGSCTVFDEMGIQWGSRDFMKKENKNLSKLFQIMRFLNFGVIMTVPSMDLIDRHGRNICHTIFRTRGINYAEGYAKLEVKIIDYDPIVGETYRKHPRVLEDGVPVNARIMEVYKPRKDLIKAYEEKKREFAQELFEETAMKISKTEKAPNPPNCKCLSCNHVWFTKSKAKFPTCPSCRGKTTRLLYNKNNLNRS